MTTLKQMKFGELKCNWFFE